MMTNNMTDHEATPLTADELLASELGKAHKPVTLESILTDRLADLLDWHTIDRDEFVSLIMADAKQEGIVTTTFDALRKRMEEE